MASYVGKINIGGTEYPIGSTLYGTCSGVVDGDAASYAVSMGNFDKLETGITIHVKFTTANIAGATKLKVGDQAAKTITNPSGQVSWSANSVISFTYDGTNWVMNTGKIPQGTVTSVQVQASSPLQSSTSTSQSSTLNTTISFTNQNANTVLAGPSSGSAAAPAFRALVSADIPSSLALSGTPTAPTANAGTNSTQIATTAFVTTAISNSFAAADAMVFKGTLGTGGTITSVPTSGYSAGATYKVITAGTYAGMVCEVGDLLIAIKDGPASGSSVVNADWTSVQTNDAGLVTGPSSSTGNNLALFDGTSGKIIKDSGVTLNAASGSTTKWLTQKGTWTTPTAANVGAATSGHIQAVDKGGTNITSYTTGDILYASDSTALSTLNGNTTTTRKFLRSVATTNGTAVAPAWDTVTKTDVGLSNVENTALSTWSGSANITTVGTISSGTWNGTAINSTYIGGLPASKITSGTLSIARGGTGKSTIAAYSIWYASSKDTLAELAANTTTTKKFLSMTGTGSAGAAPVWSTFNTGSLPSLSGDNASASVDDGTLTLSVGTLSLNQGSLPSFS